MRIIISLLLVGTFGYFVYNTAVAEKNAATLDSADKEFLTATAQGGKAEVELGRTGVNRATNNEVKEFAEMLVNDHSKANEKVASLAQKKNVQLPSEPTAELKRDIERFKDMPAAQFDKEFVDFMVKDHEKDIAKFEKQQSEAKDPEVQAFVTNTLPTLKQHLNHARNLANKIQ